MRPSVTMNHRQLLELICLLSVHQHNKQLIFCEVLQGKKASGCCVGKFDHPPAAVMLVSVFLHSDY